MLMFLSPAAGLMHKFQAHAATDVTGFGLLGHANNLAAQQRNEVAFVIHNLPIIAKMAAISKACGNLFNLIQGTSAETSGMKTDEHTEVLSVYLLNEHSTMYWTGLCVKCFQCKAAALGNVCISSESAQHSTDTTSAA